MPRPPIRPLLPLLALLLVSVADAPAAAAEAATEVSERIRAIFADYDRTDSPGCSLGVVEDDELIHARGYGMANLEYGIALSPRSVFRIGSTSKQFTAAVALLLAREGLLDLDADVRTFLPELAAYPAPVTTRHLVHHTSGYRDYLELAWLAGQREEEWYTDPEVVDLLARQRELNFAPGSDWLYSNSGYFLISQIVRAATGRSLRQVAHERIFQPLGMRRTHFHDDHRQVVPDRATGYAPTDDGGWRISMTTLDMVGDGGVFTTVEELALWDRAFYDDRLGDGFATAMTETATLPDGEDTRYGFGLVVRDYHGLRKISHGGAFVGYRAEMIRFPERRLSVICLCNRADADPSRLAQQVADLFLADVLPASAVAPAMSDGPPRAAVQLTEAELRRYVGGYQEINGDEDEVLRLELAEGRLVARTAGDRHPLVPLGEREFRLDGMRGNVRLAFFAPEGSARPSFELIAEGEEPRRFTPVALVSPGEDLHSRYPGTYECEELRTELVVTREAPGLRVRHVNRFREQPAEVLEPTLEHRFAGGGLTLRFEMPAGDAPATALRVGAGRVKNLLCERRPG